MKRRLLLGLLAAGAVVALAGPAAAATPRVLAVEFDNDVNPVTADFATREIERASKDGYDAVVLLLDTPGGLAEAMRKIVKTEIASRIPVIVYVSPGGARAASAGVWIGQAADVLAMAPQTNIGSSTPINVGGEDIQKDLRNKVVNDAAASLRSLARTHGRNDRWADAAVRHASNLAADEALRRNVIDVVAPTLPALLDRIDGQKTVPKGLVVHTASATIDRVEMGLWERILDTLIDPNIITLMLSIGLLGIVVELWNPGLIFPGTVGAVSLLVGLYGLQVLPVSWAGILLMVLAFAFLAAEPFVTSHGALAVAGGVCFILGSLLLFNPAGETYEVSLSVTIAIGSLLTLASGFLVYKIVEARRRPATVGAHALVGSVGQIRRDGLVFVNGELWHAHIPEGVDLRAGDNVVVMGVDGLVLEVWPQAESTPVA